MPVEVPGTLEGDRDKGMWKLLTRESGVNGWSLGMWRTDKIRDSESTYVSLVGVTVQGNVTFTTI